MPYIPTYEDLLTAADRIRGKVLQTPLLYSDPLSRTTGGQVYLKLESLQPGGSFKLRGATNAVESLDAEGRRRGVIAASSGNYGTALALAARNAGIEATIVLPDNAPQVKVERIRNAGARIIRFGAHYGDSEEKAAEISRTGPILIHPFDDPLVVAGQGTAALEIDKEFPGELDGVLVPVGGGGLLGGVALGMKSRRPKAEIIGVEPIAAPSLTAALEAGGPVAITPLPTCADGLSPRFTGKISFEVARERVRNVYLLSEEELLDGVRYCFQELKLIAEPSGAAGVSALLASKLDIRGKSMVVILSGSNLDRKYYPMLAP